MLLTSVVSVPAPEQNIDIVDQILNDDGTPAEGAIISLYKEGSYVKSYTTLADGIFEFRNLIRAIYEIQIVYSDIVQGTRWRDLGKITETYLAPGITNFNIVTPTLILSSEDGVTTVSIDEPGTGYDPDDPPIIAADDGFTAIGIVNSSGVLTGLSNVSPGNGTATTVDTFSISGISDLITYNGAQSQTGGASTDDFSSAFYNAINAMAANINWSIGTLAGRFGYFTSSNLNISVGSEADAYSALNGKSGASYPNYVDKGLYAYPVGTITYQANLNNFTPPNNAWAGGSYQGNGAALSGTFTNYKYGLIDYSGFFETKNNFPPKEQSGIDPQYVYDIKIPTNHPNVYGPGGWIEQLYKPCGVKTSVYEFILGLQEFNQASFDAKRYAANLPKSVANEDNLFKDNLKIK